MFIVSPQTKAFRPNQQQGAALIIAMLILSIVVVITATMTVEHNFYIRRVSNQLSASQVYSILRGTEVFTHKALAVDAQIDEDNNKYVDKNSEFWSGKKDFVFDEVLFRGELIDLQGRFNINSLLLDIKKGDPVPASDQQGIFINFLQAFESEAGVNVTHGEAVSITEAIIDYIDGDAISSGLDCGEDSAYYSIEGRSPHRTANQAFQSVSELRLICNVPVFLYQQLESHLTVWPKHSNAGININTASPQLIQALLLSDDKAYIEAKDKKLYPTSPLFLSDSQREEISVAQGYIPPPEGSFGLSVEGWDTHTAAEEYFKTTFNGARLWPTQNIVLGSNLFLLISDGKLGNVNLHLESVFSREGGNIRVLSRSTGGL